MAGDVRERMIDGAMGLLARRGLQASSFSELLAATGVPRGSLYHHFPGGKEALMAAAVTRAGEVLMAALDAVAGQPAPAVVERFLAIWRIVLERSRCQSGCAVLAVTVAADSDALLAGATEVFRQWRGRLSELLRSGGWPAARAARFAILMIASVEGAVVLSRAEQSLEPFEVVAGQLREQAAAVD